MLLPKGSAHRFFEAGLAGLLAAAILLASKSAYHLTSHEQEYAYSCDTFGYLRMARQIRIAHGSFWTADFQLRYDQSTYLVQALQAAGISSDRWEELVAPHAHHYFPKTDSIGPQYPPGTSLLLAAFPEGQALSGLNISVNLLLTFVGLFAMIWAVHLRAWHGAASIALATVYGLRVLTEIGVSSYSINAMLPPVLLAVIATYLAYWFDEGDWRRPLFAFVAGAFLGLAMLIRMPILFLAPGLTILLLPRHWRASGKLEIIGAPMPLFLLSVVCFGVVPILWHQFHMAGAWNLPTYGRDDAAAPSLEYVPGNARFYLHQGGAGALGHGLILLLVSILLLWLWLVRDRSGRRRVLPAILCIWAVPLVYFLTHRVAMHYYLLPSTFAALWLIAMSFLPRRQDAQPQMASAASVLRGAAAALIAAMALTLAANLRAQVPVSSPTTLDWPHIPEELQQGKPWIWADLSGGTLVYYADVPAFKVSFADRETRFRVYTTAFATGEHQFLVEDCPAMTRIAAEIRSMHGTLELRGEMASFPYYLIHWPSSGPVWAPGQ